MILHGCDCGGGGGGCGAGALSLLLLRILAEGQALALWPIPRQLKQRTMRDTITIYMNVNF